MVDAGINMRELPQDATTEWRIFFRSDPGLERSYTLKMFILSPHLVGVPIVSAAIGGK